MDKRSVAIALAVWLTLAAFLAAPARALPNHVIAGGVFGPGGDVSMGVTNPANVAGAAFYSTNQPGYTLLMEADLTDADGILPASFATDVGATWNWLTGDEVVVVVETVRGVNGWAGENYTTSVDGIMLTGATVQDIGDGELEAYPTPALVTGGDFVNLTWTGLLDANGNVDSYGVFRGPGPAGPFNLVMTVLNATSASFNDTSLTPGQYCYNLGVDYRRDLAGGVYTTVGRSATVCTLVSGIPPSITATSPADAAVDVVLADPIVVTFSEPMVIATVTWTINPALTLAPGWALGDTELTLSHTTPFAQCTTYTVEITAGQDLDGLALVPGPVPNPWSFATLCPSPFVTLTDPTDGAMGVRTDAAVVITFNEAMNTGSVVVTFTPTVANVACAWSVGDTVCTVSHDPFLGGVPYQVDVQGTDLDGNSLIAGPVPVPWTFTTNNPPMATLTAPAAGVCRTGGFALDIAWTMSDVETATANLLVWLDYTDGVATSPIAGPLTGVTSFSWSTPFIDASITILLDVVDEAGESGTDASPATEIDSTAPTVVSTTPATGATGVATNADVVIEFSEAMDTASTEAALSFTPMAPGVTLTWSNGDRTLTIGNTAFMADTPYTVAVGTGAMDACGPGLALASPFSAGFRTSALAVPNAPSGLQVTSATATSVALAWVAPTQATDGSPLVSGDIRGYDVYRATSLTGTKTKLTSTPVAAMTYTDATVGESTTYYYWVKAVHVNGEESAFSAPLVTTTPAPSPAVDPFLLLIVIIVIAVVVAVALLARRRKPPAAPAEAPERAPPAGEVPPAPPPEAPPEAPMGVEPEPAAATEPAAAEPEGEKFNPCPNCGTMVKPTDEECFVCGAKL